MNPKGIVKPRKNTGLWSKMGKKIGEKVGQVLGGPAGKKIGGAIGEAIGGLVDRPPIGRKHCLCELTTGGILQYE